MTETTTPRPLVDFSGTSRATAREYALAANSRVLTDASQATLAAAAAGRKVDAYALNEAVTDAMRSASTRLGQSMARRDLGRKVAYLGHITQAVLEAHADGLPVYADQGVRSRKIEEQARETALANEEIDRVKANLTEALRISEVRDGILADTVKERDIWAGAVSYILDALDDADKARVLGYIDGLTDASE